MLQLITPTGERQAAWELCELWAARQTYQGPVRWIVIDDGRDPQRVSFRRDGWDVQIIRPEHRWSPESKGNTQRENLLAAFKHIDPRYPVVCWEDDDWYSPQWLELVAEALKSHDLVGNAPNRYYHVRSGRQTLHDNHEHASLCATAMKGPALQAFMARVAKGWRLYDIALWRTDFHGLKCLIPGCHVVGIKGMPGRRGIASGHRDTDGEPGDLREWIGDDADFYERFKHA